MAEITVHTDQAIWAQLCNAGNLYSVVSDADGNLHAFPVIP